jgi:large subunit ribosomal protein L31e
MADIERIYIIPLRDVKELPRTKRAPRAIAVVKKFIARHMKTTEEDVWIDTTVNEKIWERGREKPPNKIRVKVVKFEDQNIVEVSIPEE